MRAHVNVRDHAMKMPQRRSHLRVLPMSGAVCQRRAPDPTGQAADNAGKIHRGDGDMERKEAARAHEGGEDLGARRRRGERERNGPRPIHSPSSNGDQQSGAKGGYATRRWNLLIGRGRGGCSRLHPEPVGTPPPGGLRRMGSCQPWHTHQWRNQGRQ